MAFVFCLLLHPSPFKTKTDETSSLNRKQSLIPSGQFTYQKQSKLANTNSLTTLYSSTTLSSVNRVNYPLRQHMFKQLESSTAYHHQQLRLRFIFIRSGSTHTLTSWNKCSNPSTHSQCHHHSQSLTPTQSESSFNTVLVSHA